MIVLEVGAVPLICEKSLGTFTIRRPTLGCSHWLKICFHCFHNAFWSERHFTCQPCEPCYGHDVIFIKSRLIVGPCSSESVVQVNTDSKAGRIYQPVEYISRLVQRCFSYSGSLTESGKQHLVK